MCINMTTLCLCLSSSMLCSMKHYPHSWVFTPQVSFLPVRCLPPPPPSSFFLNYLLCWIETSMPFIVRASKLWKQVQNAYLVFGYTYLVFGYTYLVIVYLSGYWIHLPDYCPVLDTLTWLLDTLTWLLDASSACCLKCWELESCGTVLVFRD